MRASLATLGIGKEIFRSSLPGVAQAVLSVKITGKLQTSNEEIAMSAPITVIHYEDVDIERMEEKDGWAISEFRLPITGADGSATAVFHSIFRPGSTHAKHLHDNCDEIAVYLSGHGVVGQSDSRAEVTNGHCRLMPSGTEHFFYNETEEEDAEVIGFYVGAPTVPGTGYKFCGNASPEDLAAPRNGLNEGILVRLQETGASEPADDIWSSAEVRLPIGTHNGSANALVNARFAPGGGLAPHRSDTCEQIYYVAAGTGVAGSGDYQSALRKGSFVFVPKGVSFWLRNEDSATTLEVFNVMTGAGSLEEAGYVRSD
ncbi:MAG: mannose-6-phosphate isomerase-like protein (cupin superfamily) [Alphaproteobacteria bacterium]|jgi:mannose-6-phosphate isomerase-like protein (cupin superfamily)